MKRTLSIILILALTFSILPAAVHAGGDVRTLWEEDFNGPNAMRDWNVVDGNADGYSFTKYWPNQDGAYAASPLPSLGGGANGENSDEYLISPPIALPDVTMEYELNFECQMVRAQGAKAYTLCRVLVIDAEAALTAENLSALEARAFETDAFFAAEDWKQVRCDLTAYRGRTVRLVFHHFDDGGNELRLDNFRILECESDSHIVRVTVTGVPEPAVGKHVTEMHESDIRIFDTTNLALVPGSLQYLKLVDEQMVPVTDAFEEGGEYEVRLLLRVKEDAFYHPGPAGSVNGRRAICALREKDAPGDEDIIQVDYYFGYLHAPEACTVTFLNAHGDHPEPQTVPYGGCAVAPKGLTAPDFLFLGWCVDPTCKTPYDFSEPVREELILYSRWLYVPGGIKPFTDVADPLQYYYPPVYWAVEKGVTTGTSASKFSPNAPCTRAQVVTFLWRAAGKPAPASKENPFKDVPADQYYTDAVLWAVEKGITTGTGPNTFRPEAPCTRGQIVTFLWRYQGSPDPLFPKTTFTDVADTEFYAGAVAWAVENGVTTGKSATAFAPGDVCTRAQIVTFLFRATAE